MGWVVQHVKIKEEKSSGDQFKEERNLSRKTSAADDKNFWDKDVIRVWYKGTYLKKLQEKEEALWWWIQGTWTRER